MKAAPAQFQPANLGLCTTALALATFMQVLDTTIANVSLPTIAGNLGDRAAIPQVMELNIGHFLIAESVFIGLDGAIREMRRRMDAARAGSSS